jgi:hypothetical protein
MALLVKDLAVAELRNSSGLGMNSALISLSNSLVILEEWAEALAVGLSIQRYAKSKEISYPNGLLPLIRYWISGA